LLDVSPEDLSRSELDIRKALLEMDLVQRQVQVCARLYEYV
jgi:hypothetical protein